MRLDPFELEDKVPVEGGIEWAVKRLRNNRSGGAVADAGGAQKGMARGGLESRERRERG